jgi:hypothetical protein
MTPVKTRLVLHIVLGVILAGWTGIVPARANAPTVVVGIAGEGSFDSDSDTAAPGLAASGLLAWREPLASGGYFSLFADSRLGVSFAETAPLDDRESVQARLSLLRGVHRFDFEAGLRSSVAGTLDEEPFIRPEWEARYLLERGRKAVRPFAALRGSYLFQEGIEDVLFQGGRIGLVHRPSVRAGYELSLDGGWEYWPEYPLYDSYGAATAGRRQDILLNLGGEADGLAGWFLDWRLQAAAGLRLSNANRYLADLIPAARLEENSESRWTAGLEGALAYSPTRRLALQAGLSGRGDFYLDRRALTGEGEAGGEALWVIALGPDLRLDWTGNDRLYLVARGSGAYRLSNDPEERGWSVSVSGGLEISF